MLFLYYEQHDDFCPLIPTISISTADCSCDCGKSAVVLSLDFLVWSIGIGWGEHS